MNSIPERVKEYIEKCKEKLIDLSRRNRLLYFRPSKRSTLQISYPDAVDLFKRLVMDEKGLEIWLPPEESPEEDSYSTDKSSYHDRVLSNEEIKKLSIGHDQIVCNLKDRKEIELALKNIYRREKSDYRERGVRILYVAFGVLTWKERQTSENVSSPIILVPVELKRESIRYPFSISPIGEDIILNPALKIKLQNELKISLPVVPEEWDEQSFQNFFTLMKKKVADTGWSIDLATYIGIFSFYKFVMYHDLDTNEEIASSNALILSLAERNLQKDLIISNLPGEKELDKIQNPIETFQILDADSSQQLCIQHALRGQSFVIQGPPGTGKSQTIANIISEFIARGKKVLFVSEKMAALEVVYKRLKEAGLSDFCLELHSHKANKREVISELNRCLQEVPVPQKFLSNSEFQKIKLLRNYMNEYVEALHKEYEPMKWSPYKVIGELSKLQDSPYIPAEFNPESLTLEEFLKMEGSIKKLKSVWKVAKEGDNFSWMDFHETKFTFDMKRKILNLLEELFKETETLMSIAIEYTSNTGLECPLNLNDIAWLIKTAKFLKQSPSPEPHWLLCSRDDFYRLIEEVNRFQKILPVYWKSKKLLKIYNEGFFNLDIEKLNKRFSKIYSKWYFRWFNPVYYRDRHLIVSNTKAHKFPVSLKNDLQKALELKQYISYIKSSRLRQVTDLLTDEGIIRFENYINEDKVLRTKFGNRFKKLDTNWNEISDTLRWIGSLRELFVGKQISEKFVKLVCTEMKISSLCDKFIHVYANAKKHLEEFETNFEVDKGFDKMELLELQCKLGDLISQIDDLQIWLTFKSIERELKQTRFYSFFQDLVGKAVPEEYIVDTFHKSVYLTWLENVLSKERILGEFQRKYHEQEISEFRSLDKKLLDFSPFQVINQVTRHGPSAIIDVDGSETGILKREGAKSKRHMPIRVLFKKIPNLLFRLKPCFMMSPISVSQFFLDSKIQFDLVIFDEASQITREDSIGSIYRGKQLIVVGDEKQLPPTPFFQKGMSEPEEEIDWDTNDNDFFADLGSILNECVGIMLPQNMLRWHYRSKYESLIAFSNKWFYDNRLVTFPSPLKDETSRVEFRYVQDGVYDRGVTRTNKREAEVIVDLVFEHFEKLPKKTLGVVTFSLPQMIAVEDQIEQRLKENPKYEKFFKEDRLEGFFVKNLENVQGDERDVIMFSIGYGRDPQGNMTMNFGPLNKPGGERRLNVAITRAREKVVIVSSIKATDIDLKKTNVPGVRHLWRYLDYGERGRKSLDLEIAWGGEHESPFEEDVAREIRNLGYEVIPQVGCSGYRIDIGVIEPAKPGYFLLGVECDGATYHSSYTARDRDRLRQQVLEKLGWRIHRIWSVDWLLRKKSEIERLKQAIEKTREDSSYSDFRNGESSIPINNPPMEIGKAVTYRKRRRLGQIPGSTSYEICRIRPKDENMSLNSQINIVIGKIIEIEGPIHIKLLADRAAKVLNFSCNRHFLEKVKQAAKNLAEGDFFWKRLFKIRGNFLWPVKVKNVIVRVPEPRLPETYRPIEYIPPEEIQNAMLLIVRNSCSITIGSLIDATTKVFGIKRKGAKIQNILFRIFRECIKKGLLSQKEERVILGAERKYSTQEIKEIYKKCHPRS